MATKRDDRQSAGVPCPVCNEERKVGSVTWNTEAPGEYLGTLVSADGRVWEQLTNRGLPREDEPEDSVEDRNKPDINRIHMNPKKAREIGNQLIQQATDHPREMVRLDVSLIGQDKADITVSEGECDAE